MNDPTTSTNHFEQLSQLLQQHLAPLQQKLDQTTAEVRALKAQLTEQRPDYLSLKRAAELGDLSYDHIRRAVEIGELPAINKSNGGKRRLLRIARSDFDRWMQKDKGGQHLPPKSEMKKKIDRYLPGVAA